MKNRELTTKVRLVSDYYCYEDIFLNDKSKHYLENWIYQKPQNLQNDLKKKVIKRKTVGAILS
jgi:hypothetical protein